MLAQSAHAPRLRPWLVLIDTLGLLAAIWLSHLVRFSEPNFDFKWQQMIDHPGLAVWAVLSCWLLAAAAELYEPELVHHFREVVIRSALVLGSWAASMALATYIWPAWSFGRGLLLITVILWAPVLLANRWYFSSWLRTRQRAKALVVGEKAAVEDFCSELAAHPSAPWEPIDASDVALEDVRGRIERENAALVVVAGSDMANLQRDLGAELSVLHFSGVPVVAALDLWASVEERLPLESLSPGLFLHQPGFGAVHWHPLHRLTSLFDFFVAFFLLVLGIPVLLLAMLLILLFDGRPVIYRQQRLGQFGRPFEILKLRTMVRDAEQNGPVFAAENDARITPLGHVLRRFRIDEMPQLINVLRGEMALVGPRPERPEFVAELAKQIPFYTFRLAVRPGVTGWAQVNTSYARDVEGHRRKLEFDLYFIREPTMQLYLLTLLRTVSAAAFGSRRRVGRGAPRPIRPAASFPKSASSEHPSHS